MRKNNLWALSLLCYFVLGSSGCVSTVVGVTGAAAKGTVKVGTGVVKAGGKVAGAVVGSDDEDSDEED